MSWSIEGTTAADPVLAEPRGRSPETEISIVGDAELTFIFVCAFRFLYVNVENLGLSQGVESPPKGTKRAAWVDDPI